MKTPWVGRHLLAMLPSVRGSLRSNVPLARYTWFRTGGKAEVLFTPLDVADLVRFLAECPEGTPFTVIGLGSNILIRDGGIPGVVIRIIRGQSAIKMDGRDLIVGAGATDLRVSRVAAGAGIAGLEFLSGVPGSIGGAIRMNASAYGQEIADILVSATVVDRKGLMRKQSADEFCFGYRKSTLPKDSIVVEAHFRGHKEPSSRIAKITMAVRETRSATQPIKARTGGSTFINPPGHTAWRLIESAGCRGLQNGGARVSEKHCNFLVNDGAATSADIEGLGKEVRRRVFCETGVLLSWEIRRLGRYGQSNRDFKV